MVLLLLLRLPRNIRYLWDAKMIWMELRLKILTRSMSLFMSLNIYRWKSIESESEEPSTPRYEEFVATQHVARKEKKQLLPRK